MFFRTSPSSRNSRRFLNETRFIPPLVYSACVKALSEFKYARPGGEKSSLEIYYADEEGDPYAVELAGRLEGYVTGRDSDFVVLNSDGYQGYLPLEEILWLGSSENNEANDVDDGFTPVKSKKKVAVVEGVVGQGIIPPDSTDFSMSATLYTPSSLAQLMGLPVSLLPLLGALVGNDYTAQNTLPASSSFSNTPIATPSSSPPPPNHKSFHNLLFERRLTPSQRILHAGATLASLLRPLPGSKKKHKTPKSVLDLIQSTVAALVATSNAPPLLTGSAEQAAIVERVVEGTLPYAIPMRPLEGEDIGELGCALHTAVTCPLALLLDRTDDGTHHRQVIAANYLRTYRAGLFSPLLMDVLTTGTFWPVLFLENPDLECVARSVARNVRAFGYSLLESGVGLPAVDEDSEDEEEEEEAEEDEDGLNALLSEDEDEDEVIDVVEEYSDYEDDVSDVDRLRGALLDLSLDEKPDELDDVLSNSLDLDTSEDMASSVQSSSARSPIALEQPTRGKRRPSSKPKVVVEYVRRGSRVVAEDVQVAPLSDFASILPSGVESSCVQLLPAEDRLAVLLRFLDADLDGMRDLDKSMLLPVLSLRLVIRRMHERALESDSKERQQERWTRKEALAFLGVVKGVTGTPPSPPEEVSEHSIQLTAQLSSAMEALELLSQILSITELVPGWVHNFSGQLFHGLLAHTCDVDDALWRAAVEGLEGCLAEERKSKKAKKRQQRSQQRPSPLGPSGTSGMFDLLANVNS